MTSISVGTVSSPPQIRPTTLDLHTPSDVEEATGRSQWDAPGFDHSAYRGSGENTGGYASPPAPYGAPSPGYGAPYSGGYAQSGQGEYRGDHKEKKSHSGMLYAAGGLAVGAAAGAVIAHELSKPLSQVTHDLEHYLN
jgi:hypothetical protein